MNIRRADREIKDAGMIRAIMEEALVCRIGLCGGDVPYVVPMNYGLGENCLYFHCAVAGRKLDMIRKNSRVCFEMDILRGIKQGEESCGWGAFYESVIGCGRAVIVETPAEKRAALDRIMEHCGAKGPFSYPDETLAKTAVIRIDIEEASGKRRE
ncbi:MAG: pyridoxamine 5'-phosphate oxidase family protein [Deltaproteobacteria bacterium]|nr:pyridoxamine 5'-phosphate oxidase family protein [Deltaproteobacteria bacterium]